MSAIFGLRDVDGHSRSLAEFAGRAVVLFCFCGCDECHRSAKLWANVERAHTKESTGYTTVVVFAGGRDDARRFAASSGLVGGATTVLSDPLGYVDAELAVAGCPRVFVIDGKAEVRYTNNHADDGPQGGHEALMVARVLAALRSCDRHATTKGSS